MSNARCLILGCSEKKVHKVNEMSAITRYDGPAFVALRSILAEIPDSQPDIYILSALHGFIRPSTPISQYMQKMTIKRARELNTDAVHYLGRNILTNWYNDILISMGRKYKVAIQGFEDSISPISVVTVSNLPMGHKLTEMRDWLTKPKLWPQLLLWEEFSAIPVPEIAQGDFLLSESLDPVDQVIKDPWTSKSHVWLETERRVVGYPKGGLLRVSPSDGTLRTSMSILPKSVNPSGLPRDDIAAEDVLTLSAKGWSASKIAKHYNCGYRTIRRRLGRE